LASLYFGIDGGGTTSRIRVVDLSGQEVYFGKGSTTNIYATDSASALRNAAALISHAMHALQCAPDDFKGGCIGSAGLDRPKEKSLYTDYIREKISIRCPVYLCNDGEILLVGGIGELQGLALIAGTGSLAIGRLKNGTVVRRGGLGYMLGDEGSAYWIVHQAISRGLRSKEGRDIPSKIIDELLLQFDLSSADDFIPLMHSRFNKADIAAKAECVTKLALEKDELAMDILEMASRELFGLVQSIVLRFPELQRSKLVVAGGVVERDVIVSRNVREMLHNGYPEMELVKMRQDATSGACMIALSLVKT